MNNLLNAYTSNGNLDAELWYTTIWNEIPCKYAFSFDDAQELDGTKITFDYCKHLFKDIIGFRTYFEEVENGVETEEVDFAQNASFTVQQIEDQLYLDSSDGIGSLYIVADHKIIFLAINKCTIFYSSEEDLQSIKILAKSLYNCFPKAKPEEKLSRVGLIKYTSGEYYTSFSNIRKTNINIEENYNDDFLPVYKDTVDFLNQRESGLIVYHGGCGTGKTSIIRHLCSNIAKDYVIVPNSVASRLGDPDFISYITSCKDYVFILEDCEQLLVDRIDNPWNNAITTILNMADGLLSDIVNIKFICTFNAEVDKIDKALLRKGRCFAKYEFKKLCKEKVQYLNEKYNLGLKEIKDMTLAEVYNSGKTDYSEKSEPKMQKIGF